MSKNKKIIIVILALAGLLVLVGFDFYHYFNLNKLSSLSIPFLNQNSKNKKLLSDDDVMKTTQDIVQSGNAAECSSVNQVVGGVDYGVVCRNNIAWNKAQANLNLNACQELDNKLMSVAECQNSVIAKLVNKEKSLTVCDKFTADQKNTCVNSYWSLQARVKNDPRLCKNVAVPAMAVVCEQGVLLQSVSLKTNPPDCSLFSDAVKKDCASYLKGNCEALISPLLKRACQK